VGKLVRIDRLVNQYWAFSGMFVAEVQRGSENGTPTSRYQNRLVFRRSMTSLPRPLITAFIMKRLKPFTWSSLIDGGSASGRPQLLREQVLGCLGLEPAWGGLAPAHLP